MAKYHAVGFDLLTALLNTWALWGSVAGDHALGQRWHAASQERLRGRPYRPFEDIVREAASDVSIEPARADRLLHEWGAFEPWPDTLPTLAQLESVPRFIVTNCSRRLGGIAAAPLGSFDLVMTAEEAGAYKPDPRPYRAALAALELDPRRVLFVAGSAHDVGGASRAGMDVYWANRGGVAPPPDAIPLDAEPDLRGLIRMLA
ncbi:MAG: HAD-IA family hydrolase [Candidatus Limnocylindria bacterium]